MPVLTEPPSMGDVLKYEVNPNYTREEVTLLQGMPYPSAPCSGASPPAASTRWRPPPAPMAQRQQQPSCSMPSMPPSRMPSDRAGEGTRHRLASRARLRRHGR